MAQNCAKNYYLQSSGWVLYSKIGKLTILLQFDEKNPVLRKNRDRKTTVISTLCERERNKKASYLWKRAKYHNSISRNFQIALFVLLAAAYSRAEAEAEADPQRLAHAAQYRYPYTNTRYSSLYNGYNRLNPYYNRGAYYNGKKLAKNEMDGIILNNLWII